MPGVGASDLPLLDFSLTSLVEGEITGTGVVVGKGDSCFGVTGAGSSTTV